jgi:hypothetical protein
MLNRICLPLLLALVAIAAFPAAGQASSTQRSMMQDDGRLLSLHPGVRSQALDDMKSLGVDIVKVGLFWRHIAPSPNSSTKPSFDATDPLAYPSWSPVSDVVQEILDRGMEPWLMISAPAPGWAVERSTGGTQQGIYKPSPTEFAKFTSAAGKKFPNVKIWSLYNEPNFEYWMWPQMGKGLVSISAVHYRKIYVEAHTALINSGHANDEILFGALAPRALKARPGQRATQPIRFLRDFFCLSEKLKPLHGRDAKLRSCTGRYKKIIATGFVYHPYTVAGGPGVPPLHKDDAPIAYLKRVYRVLDRAGALKRLSSKRIPLWNGEFAFQSDPPDFFQTPIGKVPGFLNQSEYLSYRDFRVKTYAQYQLYDEPINKSLPVSNTRRYAGFQSGLRFEDGRKKFGVWAAYEFPMVVTPKTRSSVVVWGCLRAKPNGPQILDIQVKKGSGWSTVSTATVNNPLGYFTRTVKVLGAAKKTFRLKFNDIVSRSSKPGKALKASSK